MKEMLNYCYLNIKLVGHFRKKLHGTNGIQRLVCLFTDWSGNCTFMHNLNIVFFFTQVMSKYESFHKSAYVHLVEVSPGLTAFQRNVLGCNGPCPPHHPERMPVKFIEYTGMEKEYPTKFGIPVRWHTSYKSVPRNQFTLWLAHEFFDALPVHVLRVSTFLRFYREL